MKNKTILILLLSLFFGSKAYCDTIYCCNTDTLTLWYYYQGVLHNEECDIKMEDTLFVGSAETVYVELEIASSIPDFIMEHKENDLCEFNTIDLENNIFEITADGKYSGEVDNGTAGPPVTNFYVIKGDQSEVMNPYILPQSIQTPSYEIKIRNDFDSYQWSNGEETNNILIDEPGDYTIQATNHCGEIFENTFIFDEDAFYSQQFFAGKIAGENVEYIDFDPDSTSHIEDGGDKSFNFDINSNGLIDLSVYVSYGWGSYGNSSHLNVTPQNGCKIAVDGNDKIAARLEPGQMINNYCSFSDAGTINLVMSYDNMLGSCSSGQYWNTDNYIGFSIPTPIDTLYGWMEIDYSLSGGSDLIIDGYGYVTDYPVNINKIQQNQFLIYPNPISDKLNINTQLQNYSIKLLDVFGKCVYNQENMDGSIDVNLKALPSGLYFLRIESESFRQTQKLIKQ